MELQRLVADVEAGVGGEALGHGAMQRRVGIAGVEARGGATHHQPRRLEFGRHVGELELQRLELGERAGRTAARSSM